MDAIFRGLVLIGALSSLGAGFTTTNFQVEAPTAEFAQQVGEAAEYFRRELSIAWTGKVMRNWGARCPIKVEVTNGGAGGATTFSFDRGEVYGWKMRVEGSAQRILDSVLPHEINHTIFACYFRRPLPRWADEGAASLIEHESERMRLRAITGEVLGTSRKIPLRQLLPMKEYPSDQRDVLTLYAEGYSLVDYLMQHGDKQKYLQFLNTAFARGWERALDECYGIRSIDELEKEWDRWTLAGSPRLNLPAGTEVAQADADRNETANQNSSSSQSLASAAPARRPAKLAAAAPVIRAQTPDEPEARVALADNDAPAAEFSPGPLSRTALHEPVLRQSFGPAPTTASRPARPSSGLPGPAPQNGADRQ